MLGRAGPKHWYFYFPVSLMSRPYTKKLYRFFLMRGYFLFQDTSGLYYFRDLHDCAKTTDINYNTLRRDLKEFERMGLVKIGRSEKGKCFVLKSISTGSLDIQKLHKLFKKYSTIAALRNPERVKHASMWFADLQIRKTIQSIFFNQTYAIVAKRNLPKKAVNKILGQQTTEPMGQDLGLNVSLNTIAKRLGRSKQTVSKYLIMLQKNALIQVTTRVKEVCEVSDWNSDLNEKYRNKVFLAKNEKLNYLAIFERQTNSYRFPRIGTEISSCIPGHKITQQLFSKGKESKPIDRNHLNLLLKSLSK